MDSRGRDFGTVTVEDCGTLVNPMVVEGRIVGRPIRWGDLFERAAGFALFLAKFVRLSSTLPGGSVDYRPDGVE